MDMRKYNVEMRRNNEECFDNWIGDYIEAETKEEALVLAKAWIVEHGFDGEVTDLEYSVKEI